MAEANPNEKVGCVRSIAFAARTIDLLIGGNSNGGVCRDCLHNVKLLLLY
jgi:hypothetical protein